MAAVDEVDEEGAGGGGIGIGEKAAVGVYVGGLYLFGVLWKVPSAMDRVSESSRDSCLLGERRCSGIPGTLFHLH